jgi:hypothetical protein
MIHFLAPSEDDDLPPDYIRRAEIDGRASVITFEEVLELDELPFGLYVFAGINRLGPAMAALLGDVHDQVEAATGIAPLNHPLRSLRRYELIRALHERGLVPFKAYGAWEDFSEVRLPAFVRPREADGGVPVLMHSLGELEKEIGTQMVWGRRADELIVVEFTDTAEDGLFTKYSVYRIGDRYVATSLDRGTHWVLRRHSSDITLELVKEAEEFGRTNPHLDQVAEIFELARIQFGRIDYSMIDGQVICWEINTLPLLRRPDGVSPLPEEIQRAREPRREQFAADFAAAFEALGQQAETARASAGPEEEGIRITHDPDLRAAARAEVRERGVTTATGSGRFALLRRLLQPLKPILRPVVVATIYPLLARRARRAQP